NMCIYVHSGLYHTASFCSFFCLMLPPPPISTLFPYTTLFRSEPIDLTIPDVPFPFSEDNPKKQLRKEAADALEELFSSARRRHTDRKSTRLNSSHVSISYAVFCLKKKKKKTTTNIKYNV